jgi:hypothetical protein
MSVLISYLSEQSHLACPHRQPPLVLLVAVSRISGWIYWREPTELPLPSVVRLPSAVDWAHPLSHLPAVPGRIFAAVISRFHRRLGYHHLLAGGT